MGERVFTTSLSNNQVIFGTNIGGLFFARFSFPFVFTYDMYYPLIRILCVYIHHATV